MFPVMKPPIPVRPTVPITTKSISCRSMQFVMAMSGGSITKCILAGSSGATSVRLVAANAGPYMILLEMTNVSWSSSLNWYAHLLANEPCCRTVHTPFVHPLFVRLFLALFFRLFFRPPARSGLPVGIASPSTTSIEPSCEKWTLNVGNPGARAVNVASACSSPSAGIASASVAPTPFPSGSK